MRLMQTEHIVTLLIQERDRLNRAIEALQGTTQAARPSAEERDDGHHSCDRPRRLQEETHLHSGAAKSAGEKNEGVLGR
jgi:hypothetical protein